MRKRVGSDCAALSEVGLLRLSGAASDTKNLRRLLESGEDVEFRGVDPNCIASVLKQFLRELPSPLIPVSLVSKGMNILSAPLGEPAKISSFIELMSEIPIPNRDLLRLILFFLVKVDSNSQINKMNMQNLLTVITPSVGCAPAILDFSVNNFPLVFPGFQENDPVFKQEKFALLLRKSQESQESLRNSNRMTVFQPLDEIK